MKKFKWAIRATGHIANSFAQGMAEVEDAELAAVVSRTEGAGRAFADHYGCSQVYTDFETMLKQADVDVIYLATPNDQHFPEIMLALDYKIPVLSEKPIVDNEFQLKQILDKARENKVFFMEGMWSRFFPAMKKVATWVKQGQIGEPLYLSADFSYALDPEKDQPWKAGLSNHAGALRDVGIYSLAFADMVFPQYPKHIYSSMDFNGEVDQRMHLFCEYGDAKVAFLSAAFTHHGSSTAEIVGTTGKIQVGPEFWRPSSAKLIRKLDLEQEFISEYPASGFQFEIQEVQRCLTEGLQESPFYNHSSMFRIANLIERVRKDWGIYYSSDL
ncbi:MAG: Gfo/Idh/MocA family oxidoreductase [Clostridiaceae bacterium]|jgi:predicted dehydrogenase|nr:Gfo/Idh/MocA family oxidoreductase [Clostridiaceae bacterium]